MLDCDVFFNYLADAVSAALRCLRPITVVRGGAGYPSDPDGDGRYEDVDGNGRPGFADVVLLFNQMSWIADHAPVSLFDYNTNGGSISPMSSPSSIPYDRLLNSIVERGIDLPYRPCSGARSAGPRAARCGRAAPGVAVPTRTSINPSLSGCSPHDTPGLVSSTVTGYLVDAGGAPGAFDSRTPRRARG